MKYNFKFKINKLLNKSAFFSLQTLFYTYYINNLIKIIHFIDIILILINKY